MSVLRFLFLMAALCMLVAPGWAAGHTSPLVIPAAAFHNDGQDPEGFYFHQDGHLEGEGSGVIMVAAATLPQAATVVGFTLHAVDGTDACDVPSINAWLYRVEISNGDVSLMANVATSGASSVMQHPTDPTIAFAAVSNFLYRYYVRVDFCGYTHDFFAVDIEYTE